MCVKKEENRHIGFRIQSTRIREKFAQIKSLMIFCCVIGLRFDNTMSRKESRVEGDPVEGTGSPTREPDDQEREEMSESLNYELGKGIRHTVDL